MAGGDTDIFAKYKIPENFVEVDISGSKQAVKARSTGSSSLYGNGGIRATRAGYTTLQPVNYKTHIPVGSFYLPLPDTFYVTSDYNWSDKSEEGLAEFMSRMGQRAAIGDSILSDLNPANLNQHATVLARSWINLARNALNGKEIWGIKGDGAVDAFLRGAGVAYNPNKQMYFEGPSFSTAQWNFKFAPKSAKEAAIIYNTAKCIFIMSSPGADGTGAWDVLGVLGNALKGLLFGADGITGKLTDAPKENEEATAKALQEMQAKMGNFGYITSNQPAFFSYPVLWDVGFHVTTDSGAKPVFEWKRLAVATVKLNFGSNIKWHRDGYPVQMDMDFNVQETILRTAANMSLVMPTIIN